MQTQWEKGRDGMRSGSDEECPTIQRRVPMKLLASVCGVVAVLTIVCMAAGQDTSPENTAQAKKDLEALQGTWQAIKVPGSPKTDERAKKIKFVVKGNKMTIIDSNPNQKSRN